MEAVLASGADAAFGYHLLNLIGSVHANSPVFGRVVAYDLGLDPRQRRLLDSVPSVDVRTVPAFVPHWKQGFTWKTWIWTHVDAELLFWLDAGATVLRSLGPAIEQIRERGYFVVSQGNELRDIVPPDYFELYELPESFAGRPYVAAGIVGFRRSGDFYRRVVLPTYEDCVRGRSLGFSSEEAARLSRGLNRQESPIIRDCRHFRWDQTLFNIHLAKQLPDAAVADLDEYAGWRSPRDHPRQVIWSHRRPADLRYLARLPYGRPALRERAFGAWYRARWWLALHERYWRPWSWALKARRILRGLR